MPLHRSARKRSRQSVRRRARNQHYRSMMKTAIRRVRAAQGRSAAEAALKKAVKVLDTLAGKGVIHRNKAANQKSQLSRFVQRLPSD